MSDAAARGVAGCSQSPPEHARDIFTAFSATLRVLVWLWAIVIGRGAMRLSEAIEALCVATQADGRSPRTVQSYRQKLRPLLDFLGDVQVKTIKPAQLRAYVVAMLDQDSIYRDHPTRPAVTRPLSRFTIASRVRALKRLFNWLVAEGVIDDNPARRVRVPRPRREEPGGVDWDDVTAMLASTAGGSLTDLRDRAIILLLADTGARAGGVCGLRRQDVELARGVAVVWEKGERQRRVYFGAVAREALADWLSLRPQRPTSCVFVSLGPRGGALTTVELTHILRRRGRKAGVTGKTNAHAFRHAFATGYLRRGGDLASLSALLGHRDITVTREFYAIFAGSELQELHARHSPIAILEGSNE